MAQVEEEGAAYAENGFVCGKLICNVNGLFGVIFVIVNFNNDLTTINAAGFVVDLSHQLCRISQRNAILGGIPPVKGPIDAILYTTSPGAAS